MKTERTREDADVEHRSLHDLLSMIVLPSSTPIPRRRTGSTSSFYELAQLIDRAGGLARLASADAFEIAAHLEGREIDGAGAEGVTAIAESAELSEPDKKKRRATLRKAQALAASFELGRRASIARARPPAKLTSPADVAAWASSRITMLTHEELWILAVDGRGHLRAARCVARGGLHGASVRAADPVRAALRLDAAAFVLVHNHPSGDPTPSAEDIVLTEHVAAASVVAHVPLLDHVIVARGGFECVPFVAKDDPRSSPSSELVPRTMGDNSASRGA